MDDGRRGVGSQPHVADGTDYGMPLVCIDVKVAIVKGRLDWSVKPREALRPRMTRVPQFTKRKMARAWCVITTSTFTCSKPHVALCADIVSSGMLGY